jgi:excinuclease UvrABC nuclease subunit
MTRSVLDGIPGLGPARKARLVKEMGGVNAVRAAALEELLGRSWLPDDRSPSTSIHNGGR